MSDVYREPSAHDPSFGECLWRRSSRGSILALVFCVATALLGVWLYVSDPRHTAPLLVLLGGFSVAVLGVWVISSHNAVVAMFERGLRVGWLGGRAHFVPWEEVTGVDDELRRKVDQYDLNVYSYTELALVHCRGEIYSISNRLVGAKSFQEARRVLRARVRPECFERTTSGFEPPTRASVAVGAAVLWGSALLVLVLAVGAARNAWSAYRGWKAWPHVTATVIHNEVPRGSDSPHAILRYAVDGRSYTRTSSVSTSSAEFDVGARVEQAVDPRDVSRGVMLHELKVDLENLAAMLAVCVFYVALLVAIVRGRARRTPKKPTP